MIRRLRAAFSGCEEGVPDKQSLAFLYFRTLRTASLKPSVHMRKEEIEICDEAHTSKDAENGVLSVLGGKEGEVFPAAEHQGGRLPFFTADGTLSIPFDSPERFHWWRGGQSVSQTREEVRSWNTAAGKENHAIGI